MIAIPLGYIVRLFYANNLTVSEFGLFYALLNFFGFIGVFTDLGFSETQTYFLPRYLAKKEYHKVKAAIIASFINKIVATLFMSVILFFLSQFLSQSFFRSPQAFMALRLMILYWFLSNILTNLCELFYSYRDAIIYGSTEVVRLSLTLCSIALFFYVLPNEKLHAVIWGWIAVYVVMFICYAVLFMKKHGSVFLSKKYSLVHIYKEFIPFLIPTALRSGIQTLLNNSTVMILTYLRGVEAVALYNIAQPIANILLLFITPLASLLLPVTIEFDVKKQHHKIKQIIRMILNVGVFVLVPFVLLLSLYSYEIIALLFKSVYTQASLLLKIAAFQIFIVIINNFISTIVSGFGIPKQRAKIFGIAAVINILLSFVLIMLWDTQGAMVAGAVTYIFMVYSWIRLIRTKMEFSMPWNNYIRIIILACIFVVFHIYGGSFIHISNIYIKISVVSLLSLMLYFGIGIFAFNIVDMSFLKKLRIHSMKE